MNCRYFSLLLAVLLLAGCSTKNPTPSADQYFQEGERFFDKHLYNDAISFWQKARDTYYSPELGMLTELKIAEAYFVSERYEEAATAYADFLKQHPNDFRIATVMYRLGLSYYKQILSADRDQTSTEKALQTFLDFRKRFPDDKQGAEVDDLIQRCRNRLADHEVYVGRFYLRMENYQSSIHRLAGALEKYPNYNHRDEVYFLLGKAYLKSGDKTKGVKALEQLQKQFPDSDYLEDAQEILSKEG